MTEPFRLVKDATERAAIIDNVSKFIDGLPLEKVWLVDIKQETLTREQLQNRLMWRWHRIWAEHNGNPVGWAHGSTKLYQLLPIKLGCDDEATCKRAEVEQHVINSVQHRLSYEHLILFCYDFIRSKDIPADIFASYLTDYQRLGASQGCRLTSKQDLLFEEHEARFSTTNALGGNNDKTSTSADRYQRRHKQV